jgi:hypothetical protein
MKLITPADDEHHGVLPAREVSVRATGRTDRPIALCLGVEGRNGRPGAAHGVLITPDTAHALAQELADQLGLIVLESAPFMPSRER